MVPPFYDCCPEDGLHILKDAWQQKSYLGPQSRMLADNLNTAIAATYRAAPERFQGFQLSRNPTEAIHDTQQERRLEAAMLLRWSRPTVSPVRNAWIRLVAFQVPLFSHREKEHWGYVDLLGVNSAGLPVVVELKKGPDASPAGGTRASETPLRMILEAAAYAVALRKNWGRFREEWLFRLHELQIEDSIIAAVPQELVTVPLVGTAPSSFWLDWLPVTAKGREVLAEDWRSFQALLSGLAVAGLPVSFVAVSGHPDNVSSLSAQSLTPFPLVREELL